MCAMDYMYNTTGGKYHCTCFPVLYECVFNLNFYYVCYGLHVQQTLQDLSNTAHVPCVNYV